MTTFVNLTPHVVRVANEQDEVIFTSDPSGIRATVKTTPNIVRVVDGAPMSVTEYGPLGDFPEPANNTLYIVSTMVFQHPDVQHRNDLVVPDSGPDAIRKEGQVFAVRRFTVRQ